MWDVDTDARLRREAMAWLTVRTHDGARPISSQELLDFRFDGRSIRLLDVQRGIRKPADLESALSIRTVYRPPGRPRPYDDATGPDGLLRYKWRGDDQGHPENRALRSAMVKGVPLIWFFGVGEALYHPVFPVYVLGEEAHRKQFIVDPDVGRGLVSVGSLVEEHLRRYIVSQTRRRLHQPVFRATVMRAYAVRCAVCALGHGELLDAAHIVPDADPRGIASVRNGLALCKLHHAAFDANILGISADLVVSIREDLLVEIDGPVLQHGLQQRHGERLRVVPAAHSERPDRALLEERFETFLSAG
jgi:putative restriction endonuclease